MYESLEVRVFLRFLILHHESRSFKIPKAKILSHLWAMSKGEVSAQSTVILIWGHLALLEGSW